MAQCAVAHRERVPLAGADPFVSDVSRRKRDIRTIVLKVRLANPKGAYVPGMTAEVLVSPDQLKTSASSRAPAEK